MRLRNWSHRAKAVAVIVAVYLVAFVLAVAVDTAADLGVVPAQHGPVEPAPTTDGSYR